MRATPRADFLSRRRRREAHLDRPVDIGHRQTNSQPTTVATMLELLDVRPGDRILDVGSGSGWTTALLARLTGHEGSVLGVERIQDLVSFGSENLARADLPWARIASSRAGVLGSPDDGPYDRILVSAAATELPMELVDQLREGGVMVIPVAGRMLRVTRRPGSSAGGPDHDVEVTGAYRFVPLVRE
jgi:protein-L-isoaspartate(D-aspartate) O-methyltransferase